MVDSQRRGMARIEQGHISAAEDDLRASAVSAEQQGNVYLQRLALYNLASVHSNHSRPAEALAVARVAWPTLTTNHSVAAGHQRQGNPPMSRNGGSFFQQAEYLAVGPASPRTFGLIIDRLRRRCAEGSARGTSSESHEGQSLETEDPARHLRVHDARR